MVLTEKSHLFPHYSCINLLRQASFDEKASHNFGCCSADDRCFSGLLVWNRISSSPAQPLFSCRKSPGDKCLKRRPSMAFERKHQKNNILLMFHPHLPRVSKFSIWPLEARKPLVTLKDVTRFIWRETFLLVSSHSVIEPQISTLN